MKSRFTFHRTASVAFLLLGAWLAANRAAIAQAPSAPTDAKPEELAIANAPIPMSVLVQSPADTDTELQIICLFRSDPANTLHASLAELNAKLNGLLDQIRKPTLFRGELGETLLLAPPASTLRAKSLLLIGLGDSETFRPERMELVGSIVYREADRLGVAHPYFAPTILDGGVTKFTTGEVSEQVAAGFLRAAAAHKLINAAGASPPLSVQAFTYLAGPTHAPDTQRGIEKVIAAAIRQPSGI
jgi:hypothetical protein